LRLANRFFHSRAVVLYAWITARIKAGRVDQEGRHMRNWQHIFRRLRWRLAMVYVLVTLVVAIVVESAVLAGSLVSSQPTSSSPPAEPVAALERLAAPQIAEYLNHTPPDVQQLTEWGSTFAHESIAYVDAGSGPHSQLMIPPSPFVQILDPHGNVLATAFGLPDNPDTHQRMIQLAGDSASLAAIHAALANDSQPPDLIQALADCCTAIAVPISMSGGRLLGALFEIQMTSPVDRASGVKVSPFATVAGTFFPDGLLAVIVACIIGVLCGILASHGITRRLQRLAFAAQCWSQGQFHFTIDDRAQDELGQLAGDLNAMADQLQQLMTVRQELAVIEERHRLARDLHDSIKQQLFVMVLLVTAAQQAVVAQPGVREMLGKAKHIADQAQRELVALIYALRPIAVYGKSTGEALHTMIDSWSRSTSIAAAITIPDDLALDPSVEQTVLRVIQEALGNVSRHSGATSIAVQLAATATDMRLQIVDNGHGFDLDHVDGRGMGLHTMRERMGMLGGEVVISSTPSGTRIEASWPHLSESFVPGVRSSDDT
jgi:NarL family two-component system sensor histidine kinase LiaS